MAFRSVPRPSSPPGAKASTECPYRARYSRNQLGCAPCTEAKHKSVVRFQSSVFRQMKQNANLLASGKHVYSLSISHNASERMLPRSRRPIHRCTSTSGQTWLTAARPETHQNLIHTLNDRDARTHPLARTNAPNGNIKPHHRGIQCAELLSSPWFTQSRPVNTNSTELVEANGIEPMTSCLQSRRSPS